MNTNLFIAKTLWRKSSGKGGLGRGSAIIASLSVAVSVMVMVLAIAISDGFKKEIKDKASGFSGEILLHSPGVEVTTSVYPVNSSPEFLEEIKALPHVTDVQPYAYRSAIIKQNDEIQGVVIKGVDDKFNWNFFRSVLKEGQIPQVTDSVGNSQILMSARLASMLGFKTGDPVIIYFIDKTVKVRKFTLSGIYDAQLEDVDMTLMVTSISEIQSVNGWSKEEVSGIELKLAGGSDISAVASKVEEIIDESDGQDMMYVTRVDEMFPHLFDWLRLLDFNVLVVMVLMLSVSGFNMISGLLILLFEKISMIGLLKALGMRDKGIHKIFLYRALYLVITGMVAGNVAALLFILVQSQFSLIPLDPANYFVDHVPVFLNWTKLLILNAGAIIIITLLLMIPSVFISNVSPEKTLRVK